MFAHRVAKLSYSNKQYVNANISRYWRFSGALVAGALLAVAYFGFVAGDEQQNVTEAAAVSAQSSKSRPTTWGGADDLFHMSPFGSGSGADSEKSTISDVADYDAAFFDAKSFIQNFDKLYARFQQGDVEAALLIANRLQECSASRKLSRPLQVVELSSINMNESLTREQTQSVRCDGFYDAHWARYQEVHFALIASQHPAYVLSSLERTLSQQALEDKSFQTSQEEMNAYIQLAHNFAQSGHPKALPLLAELYANGDLVAQDLPKSIAYQMISDTNWSTPLDKLLEVTSTHQYPDATMEAAVKDSLKNIYEACCYGKNKSQL
jgi:TPR repeat protein